MSNPNKAIFYARRKLAKIEQIAASSVSEANIIAREAKVRNPSCLVRISRHRWGSRNERLFRYMVHVYAKAD